MYFVSGRSVLFGLLAFLVASGCQTSGTAPSPTNELSELVRQAYEGERAFQTVAFLDQHVRWPGNEGFDASIAHVAQALKEAGYVEESVATSSDRLTFRVEKYPMNRAAWQPIDASLQIEGDDAPLLSFESNRNMLATNSYSTPEGGVLAQLIDGRDGSEEQLKAANVSGKIVLVEGQISRAFQRAVTGFGAVGILAYSLPEYLQPEKNKHSIQFRSISVDEEAKSWGIALSKNAFDVLKAALEAGPVSLRVTSEVHWTPDAIEQTVVADIRGDLVPDERFVFSAHVQEPGANDNASGVGAQTEMARVAAELLRHGKINPKRSITFIWGDEIRSTGRYVSQDSVRKEGILWGMSLDMVGENTEKTGGTFLIEKMPDPSAIWTRGTESHTEWGGRPLEKKDMTPHYFNDFVLNRALEQASTNGWVVKTNPYEGGSDHVPFLRSGIPGLLLWHFTDQFYHTDRDRIEMVSADELENVGVTALVSGIALASADRISAQGFVLEVQKAATERLRMEYALSAEAIAAGSTAEVETDILDTWAEWYDAALISAQDIEVGGPSAELQQAIEDARAAVSAMRSELVFE
ncbi:M28 family peptidase [bacterium]|nr:M28 family peptidase [bacterium]